MLSPTDVTAPVLENWNEQKDKLRTQFPTLTGEDLQYEEGKRDEMLTRVQDKLGKTREELDTILSTL
jgi:uncharacterized protein YjbJ (UPF0337 family)